MGPIVDLEVGELDAPQVPGVGANSCRLVWVWVITAWWKVADFNKLIRLYFWSAPGSHLESLTAAGDGSTGCHDRFAQFAHRRCLVS